MRQSMETKDRRAQTTRRHASIIGLSPANPSQSLQLLMFVRISENAPSVEAVHNDRMDAPDLLTASVSVCDRAIVKLFLGKALDLVALIGIVSHRVQNLTDWFKLERLPREPALLLDAEDDTCRSSTSPFPATVPIGRHIPLRAG
jgi:hypothetical protein